MRAILGEHISSVRIVDPGGPLLSDFSGFAGKPYAHLDASNNPEFDAFVARLADDVDETIYSRTVGIDDNGIITSSGGSTGIKESMFFDADLSGETVDFMRLIARGDRGPLTWQAWSGEPVFAGGGQQIDVDRFLSYGNPLKKTTDVDSCDFIELTIHYGPTISASTFTATLDKSPVDSLFSPAPGTTETVTIPLASGRNTLVLSVEGLKPSLQTAKDTDRLTFLAE
jgi:hypothetical protein